MNEASNLGLNSTVESNDHQATNRDHGSSLGEEVSPASAWFALGQEDDNNLLDYFLNGSDNTLGNLPPTPEGEPLANQDITMVGTNPNLYNNLNTRSTTNAQNGSDPFHHQQQQQPKPGNHIRFSTNQNQTNKFSEVGTSTTSPIAPEIQPPPTPVVQHFYSRSKSSSASSHQSSNQQQQQLHQKAQNSLVNLHIQDVNQFSASQMQQNLQETKRSMQPLSMLYSSAPQHHVQQHLQQHVASSMGHSKPHPSPGASQISVPVSYQVASTSSPHIIHPQHSQHHHLQNQQQQQVSIRSSPSEHFTNLSPISPAAICTSEVMMLPPPSAYSNVQPITNSTSNASSNPLQHHQPQQQQQQIQWQQQAPQPRQWQQQVPQSQTTMENQMNEKAQQTPLTQASWLQRVRSIAMNNVSPSHIIPGSTSGTATTNSNLQQVNDVTIASNPMSQQQVFAINTGATPGATLQQPLTQPQQIFITTLPHSNSGRTMNNDILPIQTATNPIALSAAALHHFNAASLAASTTTAVESKEKRERRLARNRESARQSRRRKKELLINLEAQVNKLHSNIENERRRQLTGMEQELSKAKLDLLQEAEEKMENGSDIEEVRKHLNSAIRYGGPNVVTRRAAAEFQYNSLRQLILPYYQQFFLAMSLYEEGFFIGAKEKRSRENKGSGRISSKMVGEEICKRQEKSSQSCSVNDDNRVWPLLCYELSVSLDQEERLLQAFRRVRDNPNMPQNRSKISVAVTMFSSLRHGTLYQSQTAAHRNEIGLLDILTPEQTVAFLKWLDRNKERCMKLFALEKSSKSTQTIKKEDDDSTLAGNGIGLMKTSDSLNDICNQLTEALMIAKTDL